MILLDDWLIYKAFRPQFEQIIDTRFYSMAWLDSAVMDGIATVFGDDSAAILTQFRTYPSGAKEIHGLAAAGELDAIKRHVRTAEEWGQSEGCCVASIASTIGWARVMRDDGYAVHQVEIRKELA